MKSIINKKFTWGFALAMLMTPMLVSAASVIACKGTDCNTWQALIQTANNLVEFLFRIAVALASLSFAYAGFLYLTANGDAGKIKQAHGIFGKVVLGFVIMLSAWLLVKLLLRLAGPEYSLLQ